LGGSCIHTQFSGNLCKLSAPFGAANCPLRREEGRHSADADNEYAMIDGTIVRAHQHSAGAQKRTAKTRRSGSKGAQKSISWSTRWATPGGRANFAWTIFAAAV
jgi:hypothetical protein